MIKRLFPKDIEVWWPIIEPTLERMGPILATGSWDPMNMIRVACEEGTLTCWMSYFRNDNGDGPPKDLRAFILTELAVEHISGAKIMRIYALSTFGGKPFPMELFKEAHEVLERYARENGCNKFDGFVMKEQVQFWMAHKVPGIRVYAYLVKEIEPWVEERAE